MPKNEPLKHLWGCLPCLALLGSKERMTTAACPQPMDGAEGSCPSRERENWLIFIEVQLSTACTILIKGGSFGQTGVHMGCCISSPAPAVK